MSDDNASQGQNLEARTQQHNSNLQRLIEAIGGVLAASAELLARLQQILSRGQPAESPTSEPPNGAPPLDQHQG